MKESQKKIKKLMAEYDKARRAIENIEYGARSLGKVDPEVKTVASMALTGLLGKTEEARFNVTRRRPKLKSGWAKELPVEVINALLSFIDGSGHLICPPQDFEQRGLPKKVTRYYTNVYPSDIRNPTSTLFDRRGGVMSHMKGIYTLDLLNALAHSLGAESSSALGRGSAARQLTENIKKVLNPVTPVTPA